MQAVRDTLGEMNEVVGDAFGDFVDNPDSFYAIRLLGEEAPTAEFPDIPLNIVGVSLSCISPGDSTENLVAAGSVVISLNHSLVTEEEAAESARRQMHTIGFLQQNAQAAVELMTGGQADLEAARWALVADAHDDDRRLAAGHIVGVQPDTREVHEALVVPRVTHDKYLLALRHHSTGKGLTKDEIVSWPTWNHQTTGYNRQVTVGELLHMNGAAHHIAASIPAALLSEPTALARDMGF